VKKKFLMLMLLVTLILALFVAGCRKIDEQTLSFADQATEKYLIALNNQDYHNYTEDLDSDMLEAVPEEEFIKFSAYLKETVGEYIPGSKNYSGYATRSGMIVIVYKADYTVETEGVVVTMVVSEPTEGVYKISGSWFDSPRMREVEYK
jgi:hypothetical protein